MNDRKKIEAIAITAILAIAIFVGIMLVMAQPTATVTDTAPTTAAPGETYMAYNITFVANSTDWLPTNLSWFNITAMNLSIPNRGDISYITNVSVILNTTGHNIVNYSAADTSPIPPTSFPINLTLSNATYTSGIPITNTSIVNLTINLTINTTGLTDGNNISINATLTYWGNESYLWTHTNYTNDTAPEAIEVLNATAGPSNLTAWEGDKNVLCANVTINPGNDTVDSYLKMITFNATAESTLNSTYIESFGLWNDSDADKRFDSTSDKNIANVTPPTSLNVTFDLSDSTLANRTITAGQNGIFFLTMNITETAHIGNYTAQIFPQNITINQTADEGNTGNSTITAGFPELLVDPVDVRVINGPQEYIHPNTTYVAYVITYFENVSDTGGANLTWFNVSGMNQSVSGIANIYNITNVSVWNSSTPGQEFFINYSNVRNPGSPYFTVNLTNLSDSQPIVVDDNSTYGLL